MKKDSTTLRALKQYSGYNPRYFPLCILQAVFKNASFFFSLWMTAKIVDALSGGTEKRELYLLVAAALAGILLIRSAAAVLDRQVETALEILANHEAEAFYRKTLGLDYDKLESPDIRQIRRKIEENQHINLYGVINMRLTLLDLTNALVNLAFSAALFAEMLSLMAAAPFRWLSLILLAALAASVAGGFLSRLRGSKKGAAYWDEIGTLMLNENRIGQGYKVSGMDNRIYRQQPIINELNRKCSLDHKRVFISAWGKRFSLLEAPSAVFSWLATGTSYLIVCLYCSLGAFPVGSVIKYVGYLQKLTEGIQTLLEGFGRIKENEPFLADYLRFFDIENDMYQGGLAVEKRSDKRFDISFRNVSFRYAGSDDFALRDINLDLRSGERLAVVGMNGSGKTTFVKLLCRLYDPTEGEILMNDFNIRKYDYRQYLDIFSVVFQAYNLLAVPLGNNVSCAAAWNREKAERLLNEVGFGKRYGEMPRGLETPVYKEFDSDGVELSGGEAQKVALARALYRDTPFIILDEPTAALDPIAEAEIYARFDEIVGDKTAIYISHRLSSCQLCDRILVFHEGRIVQSGTHQELLSDETGKYYELWHAQAQYYA